MEIKREDLDEPSDHKIISFSWKNSKDGIKQFVRMSNVAKLRRINRAKLAELVLEKAKQWKVDKMDNGSVAGIDQMVEEITALLQQSSDSAIP